MQSIECFICESRRYQRNGVKIAFLLLAMMGLVGTIGWCMEKGLF